uniref:Uncharacterized protein n=1 Tax=viral metagenome TaxID=1070528 RepID=A0A6M3J4G4_9ZZZZ
MGTQATESMSGRSITAGEALEPYRCVKLSSGTLVYADAGEACIGVTLDYTASGDAAAIKLINDGGTFLIEGADTFAVDASLYQANDGKISDTSSGTSTFQALEACTAAGDILEVAVAPFVATTAATVSIADAGTFTTKATVEAAEQEIYQHLLSIQQFIPIPLTTLREAASNQIAQFYDTKTVDVPLGTLRETDATNLGAIAANGGLLASDSTPLLDMVNGDTDSNFRVSWAATNQDAVIFRVDLQDIDEASDLTITIRAAMSDTNNTPVVDIDTYFGEGDSKVSDASAAITGTSVADYAITIANADIPASVDYMTVEMTPAAHANDALYLYQITVSYTAATANYRNGVLGPNTTPILGFTNGDTDSALRLAWAASNQDPIVFQTPLPPSLDTTADLVIHLRAAMASTNDTPTIASDVYFNEGDTKVEDASAAITGATYAEYTITVAAADIPSGAQTMTCELTPGAHGTDILYATALWIEHKAAILTA